MRYIGRPEYWTGLFTHQFLHGDILHLAGNMLFLFTFGNNVEEQFGKFRFLLFYLLTGSIAAFCHGLLTYDSNQLLIGASGSISGVIAVYMLMFPRAKVILFLVFTIVALPAYVAIILWFGFQIFGFFTQSGNVAWIAHLSGFFVGCLIWLGIRIFAGRNLANPTIASVDQPVNQAGHPPTPPKPLDLGQTQPTKPIIIAKTSTQSEVDKNILTQKKKGCIPDS